MKVKVLENFRCAPEGHTVVEFKKGDVLSGKDAEYVLSHKKGEEIKDNPEPKKTPKPKAKKTPKPKVAKQPKPDHEG